MLASNSRPAGRANTPEPVDASNQQMPDVPNATFWELLAATIGHVGGATQRFLRGFVLDERVAVDFGSDGRDGFWQCFWISAAWLGF